MGKKCNFAIQNFHHIINQNQNIMKKLFTLFAAMMTFVAVNAQSVDYGLIGFCEVVGTQAQLTDAYNLSLTDDFAPYVAITNNGPDVPAATDTVFLDITIEGAPFGSLYNLGADMAQLTMGATQALGANLLTADQMTEFGLEGTFEMCWTVRIVGAASDPVSSNNTACINVTRGGVGVNEIAAGEISVYPNPATDVIYVANAEGAQVSVFDMNGRMVNSVESASANQAIDASSLAKGMYIVRIVDGQNVTTKKVNVVR